MEEAKKTKTPLIQKLKAYFPKYFKSLNYPFYLSRIALAIGLFVVDYFTKHIAFDFLSGKPEGFVQENYIPGLIDLTLVGSKGAAWGSCSGKRWALVIISSIASVMLTINLLFRFTAYNKVLRIGVTLMLPGAAGNLVDRIGFLAQKGIYKDGVVDFLKFHFWKSFPVCNIADYCLSVGVVLLLIGFVREFVKEYKQIKAEEEADKKKALAEGKEVDVKEEDRNKKLSALSQKDETENHDSEKGSSGKE